MQLVIFVLLLVGYSTMILNVHWQLEFAERRETNLFK